jgi:hypothetical protein
MPQVSGIKKLPEVCSLVAIAASIQLVGSAQANPGGVPALFATKAEAEAAAKKHFNCTGAHQMGHQWMPCSKHGPSSGHSQHTH